MARDSVQNTGTDILFLSDGGVRSLLRVVQEKSLPMRDVSKNVRDDLMTNVASETAANIKSVYYERDAFYLLALPTTKFVYCFDMRAPLQDGSARVTTWTNIEPRSFLVTNTKDLYIGKPGYIGKYFGHTDNSTNYRFSYYTNYFDFDAPTREKIMKQIGFVVIGGSNQDVAVKWGFDYNENFFAFTKKLISDKKVKYGQLKRIIHDLQNIDKIKDKLKYDLCGGELMEKWANQFLKGERDLISNRKKSKMKSDDMTGMNNERKNSHLKKHKKRFNFKIPTNLIKSNSNKTSVSPISSLKLYEEVDKIKKLITY